MRGCGIVYPGDPRLGSLSLLAGEAFGRHCIPKKVIKMGRHHGCADVQGQEGAQCDPGPVPDIGVGVS